MTSASQKIKRVVRRVSLFILVLSVLLVFVAYHSKGGAWLRGIVGVKLGQARVDCRTYWTVIKSGDSLDIRLDTEPGEDDLDHCVYTVKFLLHWFDNGLWASTERKYSSWMYYAEAGSARYLSLEERESDFAVIKAELVQRYPETFRYSSEAIALAPDNRAEVVVPLVGGYVFNAITLGALVTFVVTFLVGTRTKARAQNLTP